jgi:hypothetical protein
MNDAIAIALERRADRVFRLRSQSTARIGALGGLRREDLALAFLELLPDINQRHCSFARQPL